MASLRKREKRASLEEIERARTGYNAIWIEVVRCRVFTPAENIIL